MIEQQKAEKEKAEMAAKASAAEQLNAAANPAELAAGSEVNTEQNADSSTSAVTEPQV